MKTRLNQLSRRYVAALRAHLKQGPRASSEPARALGRHAVVLGLETLDLTRIHERALAALASSNHTARTRDGIISRAKSFFSEAVAPIENTHKAAREASVHLDQLTKTLGRRTVDLATSDRHLKLGITRRKAVQATLKKSGNNCARLLEESVRLQKRLRHLTHRMLAAQEAKRTKISRELHDEIAQTLLGINVRLLTLKAEAVVNAKGLKKEIASTQQLVNNSVKTINRFAREFGIQHET